MQLCFFWNEKEKKRSYYEVVFELLHNRGMGTLIFFAINITFRFSPFCSLTFNSYPLGKWLVGTLI
jgi:hypothetical protein